MSDLLSILEIIFNSIINLWPYLIITIPLSVAIHLSGAAKHVNRVIHKNPVVSILLATLIGAFSPFCSCGVIPIIASMLFGGVPLAPIMSFWIASPSMDPEIFFLSVATLGWNLALWRLGATLFLSLGAGFLTHYLVKINWFGENYLSTEQKGFIEKTKNYLVSFGRRQVKILTEIKNKLKSEIWLTYCPANANSLEDFRLLKSSNANNCGCTNSVSNEMEEHKNLKISESGIFHTVKKSSCGCGTVKEQKTWVRKILSETWTASLLVLKFMALAFFIKAIITLYIPENYVLSLVGNENPFSVLLATLIGIPFYTSNLAAMPMIGSLMEQGMSGGAALAFLIAGPITTLPAMAAVWGITNKKVFVIYLSIPIFGAIVFGAFYNFINLF